MKKIKVDKVILYYMDRVDPDGNLYRFYVCQPVSFYKSQREIQKVNPLYAFKVATAYFREQGKVPVFEDSNCRLIKL